MALTATTDLPGGDTLPAEMPSHGRMYYLGPPLFGAAALFVIVAFRMLLRLPAILHNPVLRAQVPVVLAAVTGAGFLGGAAYVILGRPARRIPAVGPYLAGVITIAGYMGAVLLASPFISDEPLVKQRSDLVIFAIVTVLFGLFAGHSWFREKGNG
jgi:hypothetical protein